MLRQWLVSDFSQASCCWKLIKSQDLGDGTTGTHPGCVVTRVGAESTGIQGSQSLLALVSPQDGGYGRWFCLQ